MIIHILLFNAMGGAESWLLKKNSGNWDETIVVVHSSLGLKHLPVGKCVIAPSRLMVFRSFFFYMKLFKKLRPSQIHCHIDLYSVMPLLCSFLSRVPSRVLHIHSCGLEFKRGTILSPFFSISSFCIRQIILFCCSKIFYVSRVALDTFIFPRKIPMSPGDAYQFSPPIYSDMIDFFNPFQFLLKSDSVSGIFSDVREVIILHVGRYHESFFFDNPKNHYLIFKIAKLEECRNRRFIFLGIDAFTEIKIRKKYNLSDNISFFPAVSDPRPFYANCDAFIFPSLHEGFGLSFLEAQLMGLPCIISHMVPVESIINSKSVKVIHSLKNENLWFKEIPNDKLTHVNRITNANTASNNFNKLINR